MVGGVVLFYFIFRELFIDESTIIPATTLLALLFAMILYLLYDSITKIQKELTKIDEHLISLKISNKKTLMSREFVSIHSNLNRVLNNAKKREADKQKYSAKLKLKNRQRSDMISAIAHEFRNPISAIMGYAQTIQDDENIPPPLRDKFLSKIVNNSQKIEDLLSRLTLWNRFESGETRLHISSFNLLTLLKEIKQNLEYKYSTRAIIIKNSYIDEVYIEADRTLFEIVLINLIENSLKYSKDEINVEIDSGYIYIIDRGIGISSEDIGRVTKKFYRSDIQNWDNSMGLGLAIVKTILSLHSINLEINSIKGEGSTFFFPIDVAIS
jgi:signal transduction histidine kinase